MMELTTSSLRECHDMKNEIMKAITHGISSVIVKGFARPAMMYLYTMWDIRCTGIRRLSARHKPPVTVKAS